MKTGALVLAVAGLSVAANLPRSSPAIIALSGIIEDNRCVGPACATQCPIVKGPTYTLQVGDEAWRISTRNNKKLASLTGKKVVVTATIDVNNKLNLICIRPVL